MAISGCTALPGMAMPAWLRKVGPCFPRFFCCNSSHATNLHRCPNRRQLQNCLRAHLCLTTSGTALISRSVFSRVSLSQSHVQRFGSRLQKAPWRLYVMPAREIQVRRNSQLFSELCSALLRRGHSVVFRVEGASMQPNLREGDDIVVAPAQTSELCRGDIALVRNVDGIRVHRVVRNVSAPEELLVRSDTALESDPRPSHVFGKVILRRRGLREESFQSAGTSLCHQMRRLARRLRLAAAIRLRRAGTLIAGISGILLVGLALAAPSARAQADLSMTQTPSVSSVDTGVSHTYTEVATNSAASTTTVPANQLVIYQQTRANTVVIAINLPHSTC